MGLVISISTSSTPFDLIIAEDDIILFSSKDDSLLRDLRNISFTFSEGMKSIQRTPIEIDYIVVDIGPGGTSIVRTGVAFANGLGYSLRIPVCPVSSLELMSFETWEKYGLPVVCTINSIKGSAYVGLFNGENINMKHGNLESIVKEMTFDIKEFCIAGFHKELLKTILLENKLIFADIQSSNAEIGIQQSSKLLNRAVCFPNFLYPITEQSIHIYGK